MNLQSKLDLLNEMALLEGKLKVIENKSQEEVDLVYIIKSTFEALDPFFKVYKKFSCSAPSVGDYETDNAFSLVAGSAIAGINPFSQPEVVDSPINITPELEQSQLDDFHSMIKNLDF